MKQKQIIDGLRFLVLVGLRSLISDFRVVMMELLRLLVCKSPGRQL